MPEAGQDGSRPRGAPESIWSPTTAPTSATSWTDRAAATTGINHPNAGCGARRAPLSIRAGGRAQSKLRRQRQRQVTPAAADGRRYRRPLGLARNAIAPPPLVGQHNTVPLATGYTLGTLSGCFGAAQPTSTRSRSPHPRVLARSYSPPSSSSGNSSAHSGDDFFRNRICVVVFATSVPSVSSSRASYHAYSDRFEDPTATSSLTLT